MLRNIQQRKSKTSPSGVPPTAVEEPPQSTTLEPVITPSAPIQDAVDKVEKAVTELPRIFEERKAAIVEAVAPEVVAGEVQDKFAQSVPEVSIPQTLHILILKVFCFTGLKVQVHTAIVVVELGSGPTFDHYYICTSLLSGGTELDYYPSNPLFMHLIPFNPSENRIKENNHQPSKRWFCLMHLEGMKDIFCKIGILFIHTQAELHIYHTLFILLDALMQ